MDLEEYLNNLPRFPKDLSLNNVREALESLELLNLPFDCIHIAGTKGKGSTSAMIANILQSASYSTGLFLSPHLADIKERISVNGENISKEAFGYCFKEIKKPLSFFETLFVMALLYFRDKGVQIAVLETGLGGRFDATNVIEKPLISILTTIGLDHLEVLGDTIEKIAFEKAGIIKANSPTISAPQKESIEKIIARQATSLNSPLFVVGKDYNLVREESADLTGERFSIHSKVTGSDYKDLKVSMLGYHQVINASLSVAAFELLNKEGLNISVESLREGLIKAKIRGRFEVVNIVERTIILDVAHNPDSAKALNETFSEKFGGKEAIFIFAALKNKLVKEIFYEIIDISKFFIFTELSAKDSYNTEELSQILSEVSINKESIEIKDKIEAFIYALKNSKKNDIICVTGSSYLVGEIISWMESNKKEWR
jgi:dihydrofolate synthase/folylpolyglutamate synthase